MKTIYAQITPGSKKGPCVQQRDDGTFLLYVQEPAVEGKANIAACKLLAQHLGLSKSSVTLSKGATSRFKQFLIHD